MVHNVYDTLALPHCYLSPNYHWPEQESKSKGNLFCSRNYFYNDIKKNCPPEMNR